MMSFSAKLRLVAASVTAACTLAGCGFGIPSAAALKAEDRAATKASASPSPTAKPHPNPAMTVGVDLYADTHYTTTETQEWGDRDLAYVAHTLGLHSVSINWPFVIPSPTSDTVEPDGFVTPSAEDISTLTQIAESYGLKVTYRVLFWMPGRQRSIEPSDPTAFFSSLLSAEQPYLQLAEQYHVTEFIAGTERTTLAKSSRWSWFYDQAAEVYHGTLSYAQWGGEPGQGGYFYGDDYRMPVKDYGVTFYPDSDLRATATVAQLTTAWESALSHVPADVLQRTAIDETGIPALADSFRDPWDWPGKGTPDDQVQATWFAAACDAARAEGIRALWFWEFTLGDDPSTRPTSPTAFTGRSDTVAAIRACAAGEKNP